MPLAVTPTKLSAKGSLWTYDNLDTADSAPQVIETRGTQGVVGALQAVGSFGGGTVALQGSNDGVNFHNLKDVFGTEIGLTEAGIVEFSASCRYLRPLITGGSADDVDVTILLRGDQ